MVGVFAAGNYRFIPGITAFSSGVIAMPGHEIVHATLAAPMPWREGFALIERHLRAQGRPRTALCGIELRSPAQFRPVAMATVIAQSARRFSWSRTPSCSNRQNYRCRTDSNEQ